MVLALLTVAAVFVSLFRAVITFFSLVKVREHLPFACRSCCFCHVVVVVCTSFPA